MTSHTGNYVDIFTDFLQYHQVSMNVNAHVITSCIGVIGMLSLLNNIMFRKFSRILVCALCLVYSVCLLNEANQNANNNGLSMSTALLSLSMLWSCLVISAKFDLSFFFSLLFLLASYGLQDLSHILTNEPTFQGATWGAAGVSLDYMIEMFTLHVYYLIPLILDSSSDTTRSVVAILPLVVFTFGNYAIDSYSSGLPFTFVKDRIMKGNLSSEVERKNLETIRSWAMAQNPPKQTTSHWWVKDLTPEAQSAFTQIEDSETIQKIFQQRFSKEGSSFKSGYSIDVVRGMNEVYISGPNRKGTSDEVFFTEHIDGPYGFFPFCSLYRCIVGLDMNTEIATEFTSLCKSFTVQTGDVLAFDFHREPHLIKSNSQAPNKDFRIVLKLHYVVYPSGMSFFGNILHWLTVKYNEVFRALFLFTLTPATTVSSFVGEYLVNGVTKVWNVIHTQVGLENIFYLVTVSLISWLTGSKIFLYLSSNYIQYFRYILTYYVRKDANHGHFKRDSLLFKTWTMFVLGSLVFEPIITGKTSAFEFLAVNMPKLVAASFGYFVSIMATKALGIDGTYFGIELGTVQADYKFVNSFPYNVFPHPMILGQVFALSMLGLMSHMCDGVTTPIWYLPLHMVLYLTHMTQEIYDYHDGIPWFKLKKE